MNKLFKWFFTWSLLTVGLSTCVEWKLSEWDKWTKKPVHWHKVPTWNVWFTDVLPSLGNGWDKLVWDWTPSSKVEYKLNEGHELSRFVSFYEPHKWVAAWVETWSEGKPWEFFWLWENESDEWKFTTLDAHEWANLVAYKWSWSDLSKDVSDNFKTLPVSLPALWVAGHGKSKLHSCNKWSPSWHWCKVNGVWEWHWQ